MIKTAAKKQTGKFVCDICKREGKVYIAKTARHLGIHRRFAHKIVGKSASATANREARKKALVLARVVSPTPVASNGHTPPKAKPNHAQLVGYLTGLVERMIDSYAQQNQLNQLNTRREVGQMLCTLYGEG